MHYVYFTMAAIVFYVAADWILRSIEKYYQRRLQQREVIFFLILLILSIAGFTLIRSLNLV